MFTFLMFLDVKTNNILIQQTGSTDHGDAFCAIICDFGIARVIGTPVVRGQIKPFAFGLTPRYCSPEVKYPFFYFYKLNMYTFLFELDTHQAPILYDIS